MQRVGILGGTFDPVHVGHIAVSDAAAKLLKLDAVLLVPSHDPPHRAAQPHASAFHRFAMVALAVGAHRGMLASDIELLEPGPSYTAATLRRLHAAGHAATELFFITGADAFAEIAAWKDYPELLDLSNFAVVSRPGSPAATVRDRLPDLLPRIVEGGTEGGAWAAVRGSFSVAIHLLDAQTPDVSSTAIRTLIAGGSRIDGLVPQEVKAHITRHALYTPEHRPVVTGRR
jgi:nicotinate-nucleotide adenylyltransferase